MTLLSELAEHTLEKHPRSASTVLERLDEEDSAGMLDRCALASAAAIVQRLSPHYAVAVLARVKPERAGQILEAIPIDSAVRLIRRMETPLQASLLDALSPKRGQSIRTLLRFREGSAGALMDPDVLALPQELSAREALQRVRKNPEMARYTLYIVDQEQQLVGALNLRELLNARGRAILSDIMVPNPFRIEAGADRASVLSHAGWKEVPSLPVVDESNAYLGVIRYRTLREVEREFFAPQDRDSNAGQALGQVIAAAAGGVLDAFAGGGLAPGERK